MKFERWLARLSRKQFRVLAGSVALVTFALFSWLTYTALSRGGTPGRLVVLAMLAMSITGVVIMLHTIYKGRSLR